MNRNSDKNEFDALENFLTHVDFDSDQSKDIIFNRLKFKIETNSLKSKDIEKDDKHMSKQFSKKSKVITITLATFLLGVSAAYATGTLDSILAKFQVGHTEITQYNPSLDSSKNQEGEPVEVISDDFMQKGYQGKLFDKNGKEALYGSLQDYYTADGKLITSMGVKDLPDGGHEFIIMTEDNDPSYQKPITLAEVKKAADEKIQFPSYLPAGYDFKEAYADDKGTGTQVIYSNQAGDSIAILAATTAESASGVATTDAVTKTNIDGKDITLSTNAAFWEDKGTSYQFYWNFKDANAKMAMDQVEKIIQSMK